MMKTQSKYRLVLASMAALTLCPGRVTAQTAAPPADSAAVRPEEEEPIVLSPFVVEASEDEGKYRAAATLGGSRVRTELKDIASPFSVVTSKFLQDTASNNNQDLLTYTTSTEVGGLFGNWGGFGNAQGVSDRGTLLAPNQNTRVRGLDEADSTRNFFLTDIPWDSYNTERVEKTVSCLLGSQPSEFWRIQRREAVIARTQRHAITTHRPRPKLPGVR